MNIDKNIIEQQIEDFVDMTRTKFSSDILGYLLKNSVLKDNHLVINNVFYTLLLKAGITSSESSAVIGKESICIFISDIADSILNKDFDNLFVDNISQCSRDMGSVFGKIEYNLED